MTTTPYSPSLDIRNVATLPAGTGARYLLAIKGEDGSLIAKQWKRTAPRSISAIEVLIDFGGRK